MLLAVIILLSSVTLLCACNDEDTTPESIDAAKTVNGILSNLESIASDEISDENILQSIPSFSISEIKTNSIKQDSVISFHDQALYLSSDGKYADTVLKMYKYGILSVNTTDGLAVEGIPTYSTAGTSKTPGEIIDAFKIVTGDLEATDTEYVYEFSTQYLARVAKALDIKTDPTDIDSKSTLILDMSAYATEGRIAIYEKEDSETVFSITAISEITNGVHNLHLSIQNEDADISILIKQSLNDEVELDITARFNTSDESDAETVLKANVKGTREKPTSINVSLTENKDETFVINITAEAQDSEPGATLYRIEATITSAGSSIDVTAQLTERRDDGGELSEVEASATVTVDGASSEIAASLLKESNDVYSISATVASNGAEMTFAAKITVGSYVDIAVSNQAARYIEYADRLYNNYPECLEAADEITALLNSYIENGNGSKLREKYATYNSELGIWFISTVYKSDKTYVASTEATVDSFVYAYAYDRFGGSYLNPSESYAAGDAIRLSKIAKRSLPEEYSTHVGDYLVCAYVKEYNVYIATKNTSTDYIVSLTYPDVGYPVHFVNDISDPDCTIHRLSEYSYTEDCVHTAKCWECGVEISKPEATHDDTELANGVDGKASWILTECNRCKKVELVITQGNVTTTVKFDRLSGFGRIKIHDGNSDVVPRYYAPSNINTDLFISEISVEGRYLSNLKIPQISDYCKYRIAGITGGFTTDSKLSNLDLVLPRGIDIIAASVFEGVEDIVSITIPEATVYILDSAFNNCDKLQKVIIGGTVEFIGERAFYSCNALHTVLLGDTGAETAGFVMACNVKLIGEYTFCGSEFTSVVISSDISVIPAGMFESCDKIKSLSLPNTVTAIGDHAFESCYSMKAVLPESVTEIGKYAFRDCRALNNDTLKGCVALTVLGENAFYRCTGISSVTLPATLVSSTNAFLGCTLETLVFEGRVTADICVAAKCKTIVYKGAIERSLYFGTEQTDIYTDTLPEANTAVVINSAAVINFAGTKEEFKRAGYVWDERYTVCNFEVDFSKTE